MADVSDYPSNSRKSREEPAEAKAAEKEELKPVAQGVKRKKPLGKRFMAMFTNDDAHGVGNYILMDVIVPAVQNLLVDSVSQGVERMVRGDVRSRTNGTRPQVGYSSYSRPTVGRYEAPRSREISQRGREVHDFSEIVLDNRGAAEDVLSRLQNRIDRYDVATVSDLYSLVNITGSFVDDKWGWTNLETASILRVGGGYLLNLPRTEEI